MRKFDCDVVIVGAGFAGAAAACELAKFGRKCIILEAGLRVGGRGFSRPYTAGGELLEFGGGWITPTQKRVRYYASLTGIELRPRHPVVSRRFHDGSELRHDEPCSRQARKEFESALRIIAEDTRRYRAGERFSLHHQPFASVSFAAYLDAIKANDAARAQAMAWWTISGNGDPHETLAAEFLHSCSYGNGRMEGMLDHLEHTLVPGTSELVRRMISHSGAEVRLGARVASLREFGSGTIVASIEGDGEVRARAAAVCVPFNVVGDIAFAPSLSPRKTKALRTRHTGSALKLWIKARGVPLGALATGGLAGLQWVFAERAADDGTVLIVAFGMPDPSFDANDTRVIAASLRRFFPEATLVSWDRHDWTADPLARGTWVCAPSADPAAVEWSTWAPEGRLAFASSDFSPQNPGWFDSAIIAGEAAAAALQKLL